MDIVVTPLDTADGAAAEQAYQIMLAAEAQEVDLPLCRDAVFGTFRHPWPGNHRERFLAYVEGVAVGYLEVSLPTLDNLENAELEVNVLPAYRRRGIGRMLFEHATAVARENGRKRLQAMSVQSLPGGVKRDEAGVGFAESLGFKAALTDVRRRLVVSTVDDAVLADLLAKAWERAAGYSLVQWRDEAPEEYINDIAYLDGRLFSDAPSGDLALEAQKMDAARIRAGEVARMARKRRLYQTGVRHDATDRLVAFTALDFTNTVPEHALQQITIVDPDHRGHRLGTVVKVANYQFVREREPAMERIDTWNAGVNDYMISINEAMGFRPLDGWVNWQLEL
jgi:GNAT superfamily N-acetyltransferase